MDKRQLEMNRDYCVMGSARALFQAKSYDKANLRYLDIPKSSFVWPEVLFEEAWNSYYLQNYNRTLGKLVTYKAPLFDYIFNPEIEVLNALTFMKMCLYDDAKKTSDNFYNKYMKDTRSLRLYLLKRKKQYKYFYRLMISFEKNKSATTDLLENLLQSISREPSYMDTSDVRRYAEIKIKARRLCALPSLSRKNFYSIDADYEFVRLVSPMKQKTIDHQLKSKQPPNFRTLLGRFGLALLFTFTIYMIIVSAQSVSGELVRKPLGNPKMFDLKYFDVPKRRNGLSYFLLPRLTNTCIVTEYSCIC
jgi:hypothetical protein